MRPLFIRFLRWLDVWHDPNPYAVGSVHETQKARREEAQPVYATWDEYQRELRTRRDTVYQRGENVRQLRKAAK